MSQKKTQPSSAGLRWWPGTLGEMGGLGCGEVMVAPRGTGFFIENCGLTILLCLSSGLYANALILKEVFLGSLDGCIRGSVYYV
jgi:hypothetical protein